MIARTTTELGWAALVLCFSAGGCNDFETVGVLAPEAAARVTSVDAGEDAGENVGVGNAVVTIDDCKVGGASNLDERAIGALLRGGEGSIKWLYPYDGTVFPGGPSAPLLMWDDGGVAEDAVYVHMHSSSFDYRGCLKPTGPGQLQFPQQVWAVAGASTTGAADPLSLELSVLSGGQVLGPTPSESSSPWGR